jgi:hypothetical protein
MANNSKSLERKSWERGLLARTRSIIEVVKVTIVVDYQGMRARRPRSQQAFNVLVFSATFD